MSDLLDAQPSTAIEADPPRLAVAAYLARYSGWSRLHHESDLRCWLTWCVERRLDPLRGSTRDTVST